MELALKVLISLFCVPMLAFGVKAMFKPTSMEEHLGVEAKGLPGLSTIRGVAGGMFMGALALLLLGLVTMNTTWFLAVAVLMGLAGLGRVVGLALDGVDKETVKPAVVEFVMAGVLLLAHVHFNGG